MTEKKRITILSYDGTSVKEELEGKLQHGDIVGPHKVMARWLFGHLKQQMNKYIIEEIVTRMQKIGFEVVLDGGFETSNTISCTVEFNNLFKLTIKHVTVKSLERKAAQLMSTTDAVRRAFGHDP